MNRMIHKVLDMLIGTSPVDSRRVILPHVDIGRPLKRLSERQLIQRESKIGAGIFGEIPAGHRREFFNLDPSTWIWFDEWVDEKTHHKTSVTIRYEIHENGILKVREGARYDFLKGAELANFMAAIDVYYQQVCQQIYQQAPLRP